MQGAVEIRGVEVAHGCVFTLERMQSVEGTVKVREALYVD